MPTYDYKCTKCGHTFSVEQSMLDKSLTRCRKCRGKLEKQLPRSINLIFKGSGFYATDYKKTEPGRDKGKKSESESGRDKGKKSESEPGRGKGKKSESKPSEPETESAKA